MSQTLFLLPGRLLFSSWPKSCFSCQVDYYGASTPLRQLAGISIPDNSMIVIQPYDQSSLKAIEKGITVSDLGLTPNNDGKLIRLNIPQLTAVRGPYWTLFCSFNSIYRDWKASQPGVDIWRQGDYVFWAAEDWTRWEMALPLRSFVHFPAEHGLWSRKGTARGSRPFDRYVEAPVLMATWRRRQATSSPKEVDS